jgi:hypothetical protein
MGRTSATASQDHRLPVLPTLLCLYGASVAGALATSMFLVGGAVPLTRASPIVTVLIVRLGAAMVGAVVVRALLNSTLDCEISYGSALLAVGGGACASTTASIVIAGSSDGSLGGSLLPSLLGTFVSYRLLQHSASLARPLKGFKSYADPATDSQAWIDEPQPTPPTAVAAPSRTESYDGCVSATRETALGLADAITRADPADVPSLILNGIPTLERVAKRLEQADRPERVPAELHQRLLDGIRELEQDLVETSTGAATEAGQDVDPRSLLLPSTGDLSDSGPRYRWQLSQSAGLRTTRQALNDLGNLGIGTDW